MFSVPIRGYGRREGGAEAHAASSSVSQGLSRRTASIRKATNDLSTGSQNYWLDQCRDFYDMHEEFRDVFVRWRRIVRVLRATVRAAGVHTTCFNSCDRHSRNENSQRDI